MRNSMLNRLIFAGRARLSLARRTATKQKQQKTLDRKIGDRKMETKSVKIRIQLLTETSETLPIFLSPIFLSKIFAKMTDFYLYYPARRRMAQIAAWRAGDRRALPAITEGITRNQIPQLAKVPIQG